MGQSASTPTSTDSPVDLNTTVNSSQRPATGDNNSSQQPNEQPTPVNEAVTSTLAHALTHAEPLESESIERFESSQSSTQSESDASSFSLISRPHSPLTPNSSNSSNHSFEHIAPHSPNSTHSHPPSPIEVIESPASSPALTRSNSSISFIHDEAHLATASADLECNTPFSIASADGEEEKQPIDQLDEPAINQSQVEEPTFLGAFNAAGHYMCCDETESAEYEGYDEYHEYDEEDDEPYGWYDQGDEISGRCTLADVCDLRQRHQSRFGDRVTYKSQRTRKQQKQERALVLYQMRAVKAKQKDESKTAPPPQRFQSKSAQSNPTHPAYPHNTSLAEIQSYGMQRYGAELKKRFNNGFTEVVSIEPTPIRGIQKWDMSWGAGDLSVKEERIPLAPTAEFNFNPDNSDYHSQPLPALQSVLSCKHTFEGQLQRGTVINRIKPQYVYPAHGFPQLVSPWYVSDGHTPEACAAGCSQVVDSVGHQEWNRTSVELSQARELVLNSTKRCVTQYSPHRQPVQRETDQHMAQFQLECLSNLTPDHSVQAVPIADIKYRIIGLPHAKFNPHGVTQNKTLMRQFNALKMAALRTKKNKKRQTRSDQQEMDEASISMAAHFSDDELYATDEDEFQSEEPSSQVEECVLQQVDPASAVVDEPVELSVFVSEIEEEMDIEDIMVLESDRTWHRFLEGGGFEEDCHLWPRYAHLDCDRIIRKAAQPKAVTPRFDAYGTQVNLGPTQARESYEPKHTHPCRTRHRQGLGQMKGGKKTRKEMKALTLLSNQKRREVAQQLKAQPPSMTLSEKSAASMQTLQSSITPSSSKPKSANKNLTRHDTQKNSRKPRQDYPVHASKRGSSQSQPTQPANNFKNQTWESKKVIHLRDLNRTMLENAAKVESGELKLASTSSPNTYDPSHPPPRERSSKRSYYPGWNRRHYPSLRFQFTWDDITIFHAAFYQLWKTHIEQILHAVQPKIGLRILSIEPYEGTSSISKPFIMHLLSLMNDHQHGRGNPLTTELSLRFNSVGKIYQGYRPNQIESLFVKDNASPNRLRSEPDDGVRELSVQCFLNGDRRSFRRNSCRAYDRYRGPWFRAWSTHQYDEAGSWDMIPSAKVTYQLIPTRVPFRALKSTEVRRELARIQQVPQQPRSSRHSAQKSSTLHNAFERTEKSVHLTEIYSNSDSNCNSDEWFSHAVRWYQEGLEWLPEEIDYESHMADYESDSEYEHEQCDYEVGDVGGVDSPLLLSSSHCGKSNSSGPTSSLSSPYIRSASIVSTDDEEEGDGSNCPPDDSSATCWENSNNEEHFDSYHRASGGADPYDDDDDDYYSDDYHGYDHVTGLAGDYDSHWSESVSVGHRRGFNLNGLGLGHIPIRARHHIRHPPKRTAKPKTTKSMDIQRARSTRC